jgi:uncharacterized phiE125 gp8 family phage protein
MAIKIITPPAALLTLADLRLHLKLDTTGGVHADDSLIAAQLAAAHEYCEHYTGRSYGSQTLELALDAFPSGPIQLPRGPVTGVTSVTYIDSAQVTVVLSNAMYALDDYSAPAWLTFAYNTVWPDTLAAPNAVKVRYVAGASTLPSAVRAALLLIVGHLYEHRESVSSGNLASPSLTIVPMGVDALLDTQREWSNY